MSGWQTIFRANQRGFFTPSLSWLKVQQVSDGNAKVSSVLNWFLHSSTAFKTKHAVNDEDPIMFHNLV